MAEGFHIFNTKLFHIITLFLIPQGSYLIISIYQSQGSDEELRRLLEEEDVGVNSMNEEVQQLQNNINKLKHEITDLTNKKLEYSSKQGNEIYTYKY